jgi:hypothetical protein
LLRGEPRHATFASSVLVELAARYRTYPNVDNVLGPSRLFFSTYLESVWLLQLCLAARFLDMSGATGPADIVRASIAEPARAMIAEFNEGASNRQVWNNAALIAAGILCNDRAAVNDRAHGIAGVGSHLAGGLLADGSWYEGENYHQFALRGLWYGVMLLEGQGIPIDPALIARFERAFAIPVLTALPDFTMPSRKDSQYAVSLRQWRMAELLELGVARRQDPVLLGALARCYEPGLGRQSTGRERSTADIERNAASGALTRADLGWRALLHAVPELPPLHQRAPRSALLANQGYVAFRRENDTYVGFEFGQSGGGHGHPDRLNVTLYQGNRRWLDDLGTGSYVDPSLHWFRSTLAHDAPLINGSSQPLRDAQLVAYDEREGLGWIVAAFEMPAYAARIERALVVTPDYLIDDLRWSAASPVRVELPWHVAPVIPPKAARATIDGGDDAADGFRYLRDARFIGKGEEHTVPVEGSPAALRMRADRVIQLFSASGPGQPPSTLRRFLLARLEGAHGTLRTVFAWSEVQSQIHDDLIIVRMAGEEHRHRRDTRGWHVELTAGGARSSIDLDGTVVAKTTPGEPHRVPPQPIRIHRGRGGFAWLSDLSDSGGEHLLSWELGERHYRRSELDWVAAGQPTARVSLAADDALLYIHVVVRAGDAVFAAAGARNDLDNEHSDTMAAGIQLHMRVGAETTAFMLVPERESSVVRVRASKPGPLPPPAAHWRPLSDGYEMRIEMPIPTQNGVPFALDVLVNETTRDRVRRRGQLVLSGARGEFVYLRGDRQDDDHFIPLVIVP